MATVPQLKVEWPSPGPTVTVDLDVEPVIRAYGYRDPETAWEQRLGRIQIAKADLLTVAAIQACLRRITAGQDDHATVNALILEPRLPALFQLLGIPNPPPDEFVVKLPNG